MSIYISFILPAGRPPLSVIGPRPVGILTKIAFEIPFTVLLHEEVGTRLTGAAEDIPAIGGDAGVFLMREPYPLLGLSPRDFAKTKLFAHFFAKKRLFKGRGR